MIFCSLYVGLPEIKSYSLVCGLAKTGRRWLRNGDTDGFLYYIASGQQLVVNDSHHGACIQMLQDQWKVMRYLVSDHMRTGRIVLEVTNESARHAQHAS
jgi:hypothetical protein